jgi:hypothetical protein
MEGHDHATKQQSLEQMIIHWNDETMKRWIDGLME